MELVRISAWPLTRVCLSLISAALLICSLPSPDIGWLGWVALVPLLLACHDLPPLKAAGLGFACGITASFGIYGWLFEVPNFDLRHALLLAIYVGIYPTAWCAATTWLTRRHLPLIVTAPVLWVSIDYLRAHAGFLALPWGTLAQSQHDNLAILQVASVGGEYAVTCLVALGNAALASLMLRREQQAAMMAVGMLALAHLWGAAVLLGAPQGPTIRVAAIQPNIQITERETEAGRRTSLARLEQLTRAAAATRPSLVVWPESAVPGDLRVDLPLMAHLQQLTDAIGIPLILGAAQVEKFAKGDTALAAHPRIFNTAHFFQPGNSLAQQLYRKRVLVPFAEYVPHADIIPWPKWLAPRVTQMTPGEQPQLFAVTNDLAVGVLICWENLFAPLARESVGDGAQLLVQLTNDVWFGRSAAPRQHNVMSVMRAVENRTPILIASNTGPSQLIDGYGRVVAAVPTTFSEGIATGAMHAGGGGTLYSAIGDVFVLAAMGLLSAVVLWPHVPRLLPSSPWIPETSGEPNFCARPEPSVEQRTTSLGMEMEIDGISSAHALNPVLYSNDKHTGTQRRRVS